LTDQRKHTLTQLANSFLRQGKLGSARDVFDYLSALYPECADTLNAYALILFETGDISSAKEKIICACDLDVANPDIYNNAGVIMKALNQLDAAISHFNKAISLKPDHANAHYNKANSLRIKGEPEAALACFERAIHYQPDFANAYYNRAKTLHRQARYAEAAQDFQTTLTFRSDDWASHYGLGNTLFEMGALTRAISHLELAASLKPDHASIHVLLGDCWRQLSHQDRAKQCYQNAISSRFGHLDHLGSLLFSLHYLPDTDFYKSVNKAGLVKQILASQNITPLSSSAINSKPEKLRVGFVSADLNNHPVGYFLEQLVSQLDKTRFDWIAFPVRHKSDRLTERLKPHFCEWLSIDGYDDKAAARFIHDQKIDILIDLSGHTAYNRLPVFGWRPAPVQASWLGYFATTGLSQMDYIIGDPYVTPFEEQPDFTETIAQMPACFLCFSAPETDCPVNALPAHHHGYVTFGCFNHSYKLNAGVLSVWAEILKQVPDSRLFLKSKKYNFPEIRTQMITAFTKLGINPSRLIIEGASPRHLLLQSYHQIDIALDPFPFPGVTTSVESLWMGVPVLTRTGSHFLSHVGEMLASNIGLTDWIAVDDDDYISKAVAYAGKVDRLAIIRSSLRDNMKKSPLYDARKFARNFEQLLTDIWTKKTVLSCD